MSVTITRNLLSSGSVARVSITEEVVTLRSRSAVYKPPGLPHRIELGSDAFRNQGNEYIPKSKHRYPDGRRFKGSAAPLTQAPLLHSPPQLGAPAAERLVRNLSS